MHTNICVHLAVTAIPRYLYKDPRSGLIVLKFMCTGWLKASL